MQPQFQSSFIPKSPVVNTPNVVNKTPVISKQNSTNLFSVIANTVFFITIIVLGGAFLYKFILARQILKTGNEINSAREAFELDKIKNLIDEDSRIKSVSGLVNKHQATSQIIALLQELTLKKLRFTSFDYKSDTNTITLDTEAQTYNALAKQSDILSSNNYIQRQDFSSFRLLENGNVKSRLVLVINPALLSYKRLIESSLENQ